jgi:acyl carrier protein
VNANEAHALLGRLLHGIAPDVDLTDADPHALLQEALDLDSMDFLNLVTALHEETGIDVPERDYPQLASIDGFVAYVTAAPVTAAPRERTS